MKFFSLALLFLFIHGNNVATYTLTKDNNTVNITANLDASDLALALHTDSHSIQKDDLVSYLNKHISYTINHQLNPFVLNSFTLKHNHVIINLSLTKPVDSITQLDVKNTSLFEVNTKQSNIIEIRFDGMVRDFLINKDNPVLTISL